MDYSGVITQTFQLIKAAITDKLGKQGYVVVEEKDNDLLFESRFTIWSNNEDMLKFTWNGVEKAFSMEVTTDLPITPLTAWTVINITPFAMGPESHESVYSTATLVLATLEADSLS